MRQTATWNLCGDTYISHLVKSFSTLTDAERFLSGDNSATRGSGTSPTYKFYAVRNGRIPGIYTDWPSAQAQITGWMKPKYKCFSTRAEAQRFLGEAGRFTEDNEPSHMSYPTLDGTDVDYSEPYPKKPKRGLGAANSAGKLTKHFVEEYNPEHYEAGMGPLPPGAQDGFDPNILLDPKTGNVVYKTQAQKSATKLQAIRPTSDSVLRVFTDGSSLRNGQQGAFAGVGVYFGPNDQR